MASISYTTAQVSTAKDSPIYAPTLDSTDTSIYGLMSDPDQDTIDYYTRAFMSLPTSNVYAGVLENPHYCDIQDIQHDMNHIKDNLNNLYKNGSDSNGKPNSSNSKWQSEMDPNNKTGIYYMLFNDPYNGTGSPVPTDTSITGDNIINGGDHYSVTTGIDLLNNHTNRLISNLPSILGMIQTALGLASAIGNLLNPCSGLSSFLSSLLDEGKQIIATIKKYLKEIIALLLLGPMIALAVLNALIKTVLGFIKEAIDFITSEIKKLVKALIDSLKAGISAFLKSLNLDPCASFLLKTVTTGAASYAIGKI